jgi:antitoxin component of MazEF toxin-antitoxin module
MYEIRITQLELEDGDEVEVGVSNHHINLLIRKKEEKFN